MPLLAPRRGALRAPRAARARLALAALLVLAASAFAAAGAAAAPRNFYGVVPQTALTEQDFELMGEGRVGTLRFLLFWPQVDPSAADGYNWAAVDQIVLGAAAQGIRPLPQIYGTPNWVAAGLDNRDCLPDCSRFLLRSDAAVKAYRKFIGDAVERYGPGGELWDEYPGARRQPVKAWQIGNEQNSTTFSKPQPSAKLYARQVVAAGRAIHSRHASNDVVLGGMFATPGAGTRGVNSWIFLRKLYDRRGFKRAIDGVAVHPYSNSTRFVKRQVRLLLTEVRRAKDHVGTWITEIGWASGGPDHPLVVNGQRAQARKLRKTFRLFERKRRRWNVKVVAWFSWRDTPPPGLCTAFCARSGLFTVERKPKKAWFAFKRLAR